MLNSYLFKIKRLLGRNLKKVSDKLSPSWHDQILITIRNSKFIDLGKREYDLGEFQLYIPSGTVDRESLLEAIRMGAVKIHGDGYEVSVQERFLESGASMSSLEYMLTLFQYTEAAAQILEGILLAKLVGRYVDKYCPDTSARNAPQDSPERIIETAKERLAKSFGVDKGLLVSPALNIENGEILVKFCCTKTYVYYKTPNGVEGVFWHINEPKNC